MVKKSCSDRSAVLVISYQINAGWVTNAQFNLKEKLTLEFCIILSLMLIVSQQICLKLDLIFGFRLKLI